MEEKPTLGYTFTLLQGMIFNISTRINESKKIGDRLVRYTIPESVMMVDDLKSILQWFINVLGSMSVTFEVKQDEKDKHNIE